MDLMSSGKRVLAFDFGASSGRAILGIFDGKTIQTEEVHRFTNDPVIVNGTMYWDVLRLFFEIKQSLLKAKVYGKLDSIGIDTWGVDFGLLDKDGALLENPVHYRDSRTIGMLEKSFGKIDKDEFYQITGNQFMEINTAFQLLTLREKREDLLKRADSLLLMPDLFNYFLTGQKATEYSIASTTQLVDANKRNWSDKVIKALELPEKIFTNMIPSGTVVGMLSESICSELEIESAEVVAVAGHDTQSALVSVPSKEKDFIFLSCGTWSLLGTELDNPVINGNSLDYNITNEGAFGNKVSFLKNIIGLWLVQESRRQWIREGREYGFGDLEKMAQTPKPFQCFIDPDDPVFVAAGNIPQRIREYCEKTGQWVPKSEGEIVRCINESLALKYRYALAQIKDCTKIDYTTIYMVGGGIQSKLLCQLTANASKCKVSAGPIEATVLGNIAVQLIAKNEIKDLEEAREVIRNSSNISHYTPEDSDLWDSAYSRFKEVIGC